MELMNAECYGEDDREAIVHLIGERFSDDNTLDSEDDRQRLGVHNFENFVRHDIAMHLEDHGGTFWGLSVRSNCIIAFFFLVPTQCDYLATEGIGLLDAAMASSMWVSFFLVYFAFWVFGIAFGSKVYLLVKARVGKCKLGDISFGSLLTCCAAILTIGAIMVKDTIYLFNVEPQQFFNPGWAQPKKTMPEGTAKTCKILQGLCRRLLALHLHVHALA